MHSFEQLELSLAEENEKRIIKKEMFCRRYRLCTILHILVQTVQTFAPVGASDNFKSPRVDYTEGMLAFLYISNLFI